ncbi:MULTISPECIES: immunoglobulin-like domain-containing protein [Thermococcus]|uniref:Bacterial Ig-like domain-containing protein n=1 Tax=Thermococcus barossii TaxID=54077 RepID=A0A2Z2MS39_9EURY|nr:immunoglobulin-like domain-containing protein [Thermococcus barossii]ASJ04728.1 hypothetical protein A3L01_04870 [Thermococcus barossii]NJE76128.1 hypothetical protein [Thermococcus sp. ES12]
MNRIIPVLLIVLLVPLGYYLTSTERSIADSGQEGDAGMVPIESNGIVLKLDRTSYSPRDTMVLRVINKANLNATTSYHFKLYRLENGEWKEVPVNLVFIEVAVVVEPGKSWEQRVKLSSLNLGPGHYKIVKKVSLTGPETGTATSVDVWAEFDVNG